VIGKTISHFSVLEKLGEGGMGQVFLALDTDLDRRVALKFLPSSAGLQNENEARLLQEARVAAALNHPNICTIHEIGVTDDGSRFIAMENVPGESLADLVAGGALDWPRAQDLIRKVAKGLAHAHGSGVIHRDIKPSNIMVTTAGEPKILDFGLARLTAEPHITRTGTVMGTLAYMSPEQLHGEDPDQQSDIWALGVVFYQMLTGALPFKGEYEAALVYSISHGEIPRLETHRRDLPGDLQTILDRLLARDRTERYAGLEEFLADLDAVTGGEAPARGPVRRRRAKPRRAVALAVLALAGLTAVGIAWRTLGPAGGPGGQAALAMAVLPLENLSGNPDQTYFADGITSELIAGLTRVGGLRVMARGSVLEFRDSDLTVAQIADKLGVDHVVTGSILDLDNTLQVSLEIIDTAKGFAVWADNFQGSSGEVLQLQNRIARAIVEAVKGEVAPEDEAAFAGAQTVDPEAYRQYLKGKALADTWGYDEIWKEALGHFREAARIEPEFAPAYAGQSEMCNYLGWFYPEDGWPAMCEAAARKAIALDPDLPAANTALATSLFLFENRYAEADSLFGKALQVAAGDVDVLGLYRMFLMLSGQCDEAVAVARRAAALDPLNTAPSRELAVTLINCNEFAECIELLRALEERFGDAIPLNYFRAEAYLGLGQIEEAVAAADSAETGKSSVAFVYWLAGRRDEAWELVGGRETVDPSSMSIRILLLVLEEDYDQAIDLLEQFARARPVVTKFSLNFFLLEPLRDQPRYRELMRSMNIPGY
jgi:TolB-like protein/predicted Ser/Thr protein kinase